MSEFSRDLSDYLDFDLFEYEDYDGYDSIVQYFEEILQQAFEKYDWAESDAERKVALEEIDDLIFSRGEVQTAIEEQEFLELLEYMSQPYKDDKERIDRYNELKGKGY